MKLNMLYLPAVLALTACDQMASPKDPSATFAALTKQCIDTNTIHKTYKTVRHNPSTGSWIVSFYATTSIKSDASKTESIISPYKGVIDIEYLFAEYAFRSEVDANSYESVLLGPTDDVKRNSFKLTLSFTDGQWKISEVSSTPRYERSPIYSDSTDFLKQFPSGKACLPT